MSFLAIGINHNTATVAIREKVSFTPETMSESLHAVLQLPGVNESVILSTCNRSEIYCEAENPELATQALLSWLAGLHHLELEQLKRSAYIHTDKNVIDHISKVAAGLDSMVLGEPQILGQLKSAYAVASEHQSVGSMLNYLFQHSFKVAKKVRTETAIGENAVSIAFAAVSLSSRIFSNLEKCRALLVGAGETIDLVAKHLQEKGVTQLTIANRTLAKAEELAKGFNARACMLADIPDELPDADIVITSTASQLPLIGKGVVERALKKRKHKPMFMVDIAVPRDIESEVADLSDVFLYTVDDLRMVIEDNRRSREEASIEAQDIIRHQTESFISNLQTRSAGEAIKIIRNHAQSIKAQELEKAERALKAGGNPEKVMHQLAHNITNKLMHGPTMALRNAQEQGEHIVKDVALRMFEQND